MEAEEGNSNWLSKEEISNFLDDRSVGKLQDLGGIDGIIQNLHSSKDGLTPSFLQKEEREQRYGKNVFPSPQPKGFFRLWAEAFCDITLIILIVLGLVSLIIALIVEKGDNLSWLDGVAILITVLVVTLISSINTWRQEKQFEKLNERQKDRNIIVTRGAKPTEISIFDLLVGDIFSVSTGDVLPADGLVVESFNIQTDEASITGESDLVKKTVNKNPYMLCNCRVQTGFGKMVVVAVGMNTQFGILKGATITAAKENKQTPLQEKLDKLAKYIGYIGFICAGVTLLVLLIFWIIALAQDKKLWDGGKYFLVLVEYFTIAVTIVVMAVPEGLPLAVTLSLAYSMRRMLRDNNLVRRLASCETMGGATTICSDKTGTLTQNKMKVTTGYFNGKLLTNIGVDTTPANTDAAPGEGEREGEGEGEGEGVKSNEGEDGNASLFADCPEELKAKIITAIATNSSANITANEKGGTDYLGNVTECAMLLFSQELGYDYTAIRAQNHVVQTIPFSSDRKRMTVVLGGPPNEENGGNLQGDAAELGGQAYRVYTKGASEIVTRMCTHVFADGAVVPLSTDDQDVDNANPDADTGGEGEEARQRRAHILANIATMARSGLRTIAIAYRDVPVQTVEQIREVALEEVREQEALFAAQAETHRAQQKSREENASNTQSVRFGTEDARSKVYLEKEGQEQGGEGGDGQGGGEGEPVVRDQRVVPSSSTSSLPSHLTLHTTAAPSTASAATLPSHRTLHTTGLPPSASGSTLPPSASASRLPPSASASASTLPSHRTMHTVGRSASAFSLHHNKVVEMMPVDGAGGEDGGESEAVVDTSVEVGDASAVFPFSKYAETDLTLLAIVGIKDPLRSEVKGAIASCKTAKIVVRMVTGDNIDTAMNIAAECGIYQHKKGIAMEGAVFRALPEDERERILPRLQVLARSSPIDKQILVRGLKKLDHVVAVTGDGTNDAPALSASDVGFAMGIAGTEVCKDAASIILTDDNFASIVKAVMWGRNIYDSIRKFLQFQFTVNFSAIIIAFVGAIFAITPLKAVPMLWTNLIMDTFAALALATDEPTPALLLRKPYGKKDSIVCTSMYRNIIGGVFYEAVIILLLLFLVGDENNDENYCTRKNEGSGYKRQEHYVEASEVIFKNGICREYLLDTVVYVFTKRHFAFIFNTFIFMQMFNLITCRKCYNELNFFEGIFRNWLFIAIWIGCAGAQIVIMLVPGIMNIFSIYPITPPLWGFTFLFSIFIIPFKWLLHLVIQPPDPFNGAIKIVKDKDVTHGVYRENSPPPKKCNLPFLVQRGEELRRQREEKEKERALRQQELEAKAEEEERERELRKHQADDSGASEPKKPDEEEDTEKIQEKKRNDEEDEERLRQEGEREREREQQQERPQEPETETGAPKDQTLTASAKLAKFAEERRAKMEAEERQWTREEEEEEESEEEGEGAEGTPKKDGNNTSTPPRGRGRSPVRSPRGVSLSPGRARSSSPQRVPGQPVSQSLRTFLEEKKRMLEEEQRRKEELKRRHELMKSKRNVDLSVRGHPSAADMGKDEFRTFDDDDSWSNSSWTNSALSDTNSANNGGDANSNEDNTQVQHDANAGVGEANDPQVPDDTLNF